MFNLIMIETAQKEREREVQDEVRRRQLAAHAAARPVPGTATTAGRTPRREGQGQPARLATP